MNVGPHRQLVLDDHTHLVPQIDSDLRSGHHFVVCPGVNQLPWLDLPGRYRRRQREFLCSVRQDCRLERLVALTFSLGRESKHRLRHGIVQRLPIDLFAVIIVSASRSLGALLNCECRLHAGLTVPRDGTKNRVGTWL